MLFGRNIFEAVAVREVNQLMEALANGAKLTYIDPRVTVTATKATRYWMIRPATDLALAYGLIHVILTERLYDAAFVERWVLGLNELQEFVRDTTPEWAEKETGIPAAEIVALAREVSADKPSVIFHYGYRGAHLRNEIYLRRAILMLNVLMGNVEAKGGMFFKKGPGEVGRKPPRKLTEQKFPPADGPRLDRVGTPELPLPDPNHGVPQMLTAAILNESPYPVKALFINRFDALKSIPDTAAMKAAFAKLDLIVAVDVNYSDSAWFADVILPESTYLERTDCVQQANGLKPQLFYRKQAVAPRYDTREAAMIFKQLGERLGIGAFFPYSDIEDLVRWQLEGTGFSMQDLEAKGFVAYGKDQIFWDRKDGLKLKTPSGKIEFKSSLLEKAGFDSFPAYEPVPLPPTGQYRLVVGRMALHTHVSTQNNPYLNELFPENVLWINSAQAQRLGIKDKAMVEVSSTVGAGRIRAHVTDLIHPECVFMIHGFGHEAETAARCFAKVFPTACCRKTSRTVSAGVPRLHETFVSVKPA